MARVEEEINLRGEGARRAPTFRIMRNTPQVAAETPPSELKYFFFFATPSSGCLTIFSSSLFYKKLFL